MNYKLTNLRNKYKYIIYRSFLCIFACYIFVRIIELSTFPFNRMFLNIIRLIAVIIVLLKVLIDNYSKKFLLIYFLMFFLSIIVWIYSKSFNVVDLIIFGIGSHKIKFINIIKCFLIVSIPTLIIITLFSQIGIIDNYTFYRENTIRQALGFYYPTDYVAMVFYILTCLLYVLIIINKLKYIKYLLFIVLSLVTFTLCNSRLGSISIFLLIPLGIYIEKRSINKLSKIEKFVLSYSMPLFFILIFFLIFVSILLPYNPILQYLDKILSYRIFYSKLGVLNYGFSLFGQYIYMQVSTLPGEVSNYFFLDSSYVNITLRYGLIVIFYILFVFTIENKKELNQNRILVPCIILIIGLNSLVGQQMLDLVYNPFLLLPFTDGIFSKFLSEFKTHQEDTMKIYYFSESIKKGKDAGNKARNDVEQILSTRYEPLYPFFENPRKKIIQSIYLLIKELLKTNYNDYIIIQYPLPIGYNKFLNLISHFRKVIVIIHDLTELRTGNFSGNEEKRFQNVKYIISHNNKMSMYLMKHDINQGKIINLDIFDYLTTTLVSKTHYDDSETICFAGNLAKSDFIYSLPEEVISYGINLYGINFDNVKANSKLHYKGAFDSEIIHEKISGKFGLIWDGNSCKTCAGNFGLYMKYNNPHKLSMYIAAKMPVIVWKDSAIADYVIDNQIGYVIDNLDNLSEILKNITKEDYLNLEKNVVKIQKTITIGNNLKNKLDIIESKIGCKEDN